LSDGRSSVSIKVIPLSKLEADPLGMLNECLDSGQALVVEVPDHRRVAIHGLDSEESEDLVDRLLESNPSFRSLVEKSKLSPRRSFPISPEPLEGARATSTGPLA
jgi:hypothetical protein